MDRQNLTLLTDLYELTMMQGYFRNKDQNETVIFDAFYRSNPMGSGYAICAGLQQVIDLIKNLHFSKEDIVDLRQLINAGLADKATDTGYVLIGIFQKMRGNIRRFDLHAPKFV